ncbi:MAG: hypothetical protein CENE_01558 [Candidatus Celerinatantimonas neptuna]|nr:MAG: hypothetical protein CENE_01558 [Candidatus Celerinatantimonas neptuna]
MNQEPAARISAYGVMLRPVCPADLPSLRRWRNSEPVRCQMLSQQIISARQQRCWFERMYDEPSRRHWCVEVNGLRTGYANLKGSASGNLAHQACADSGLYLGDTPVRHGLLATAVALCQLDAAFELLHIKMIKTQVKCDNSAALRLNSMLGYQRGMQEHEFITLTLVAKDYFAARQSLMRFFRHV